MTDETLQQLYAIRHPDGFWKIGTASDARHRLTDIQTGSPYELTCEYILTYLQPSKPIFDHAELEVVIQKRLSDSHVRGEWYDVSDELVVDVFERAYYEFDFVDGFYQYPDHEEITYREQCVRYNQTFMRVTE